MPRHGSEEDMMALALDLQARGDLPPGVVTTAGCVLHVVQPPYRVTMKRYAPRDAAQFRARLDILFWGTVTEVDGDILAVRWDVGGGTQLCAGHELILVDFQATPPKPVWPVSEWWKQVKKGAAPQS